MPAGVGDRGRTPRQSAWAGTRPRGRGRKTGRAGGGGGGGGGPGGPPPPPPGGGAPPPGRGKNPGPAAGGCRGCGVATAYYGLCGPPVVCLFASGRVWRLLGELGPLPPAEKTNHVASCLLCGNLRYGAARPSGGTVGEINTAAAPAFLSWRDGHLPPDAATVTRQALQPRSRPGGPSG